VTLALATVAPEASVTVPVMLLTVCALSTLVNRKKQAKRQERLAVFRKKPDLTGAFRFLLLKFNKEWPLPRQNENVCES
jgi:hypothetical protein